MKIKCMKCGHTEKINFPFFCKVLGLGTAGLGGVTAVASVFLGAGLSIPLTAVIIAGGLGIGLYSDEILVWVRKKFSCPKCGSKTWGKV